MKKMFITALIFSLFIASSGVTYAINNETASSPSSDLPIVEKLVYEKDDVKYVETNVQNEQIDLETTLKFDEFNNQLSAVALLKNEDGNDLKKHFSITILEITNEEDFKALFVDKETNEQYIYDSKELKASAFPLVAVIVGVIARQGLKTAIKNWSKSVVSSMKRSIPAVAKEAAKDLGYSQTNYLSHGQKVFIRKKGKGPKYITPDTDGHNGGAWKGASSVKNLGKKKTRSGTYDPELKRIGD